MKLPEKDLLYIWHPGSQMKDYENLPPIVVDHAKGAYLYDIDGRRYLDVMSSWWCNLLGHCNERINTAVKKQLDRLEHVIFANFSHEPAITLCEKLASLVPPSLTKFFFTDNGSSAVEAAMKMSFQYCRQTGYPKKKRFMALENAYHGETLGALSVGGLGMYSEMYKPLLLDVIRVEAPDCYRCRYGKNKESCAVECFIGVERAFAEHADETCAILVEPILQAAAGMRVYPSLYLKKLKALCEKHNVHLIADEIATGFGRTGKMFACEHAGVSPDIMCLSKGLTGGYMPMALVVATDKIYGAFYADYLDGKAFLHSHTYCGNPLACAAALETLSILEEENVIAEANKKAEYFSGLVNERLSSLRWAGDIRKTGLIHAIELVEDREKKRPFNPRHRCGFQIYKKALTKGVLMRPLGDVLYFNPPLVIDEEGMELAVEVCAESIEEVLGR